MAPVVTFVYIVWVFFDSYDYRKHDKRECTDKKII